MAAYMPCYAVLFCADVAGRKLCRLCTWVYCPAVTHLSATHCAVTMTWHCTAPCCTALCCAVLCCPLPCRLQLAGGCTQCTPGCVWLCRRIQLWAWHGLCTNPGADTQCTRGMSRLQEPKPPAVQSVPHLVDLQATVWPWQAKYNNC